MALLAPVSGWLVGSRGARMPMVLAGVAIVGAGLMLMRVRVDTSFEYLAVAYLLLGVGSGLVNAPITNAAVSGMPRAQAGVASGIASVSRQVGTSLGVAIFGAVAFREVGDQADLAAAARPAWLIMALCGLAIIVVGIAATGRWAASTLDRTRERILATETARPCAPKPEPRGTVTRIAHTTSARA